jgi:hypothetical protein
MLLDLLEELATIGWIHIGDILLRIKHFHDFIAFKPFTMDFYKSIGSLGP